MNAKEALGPWLKRYWGLEIVMSDSHTVQLSDALDAARWQFLREHFHSLLGGIPLHQWLPEQLLRRGGLNAAIDWAMNYHANGERHIAGSPASGNSENETTK